MTAIHWLNAINGSFTNPANWSGGVVPGESDDAILDAVGVSPYTVTASASTTVSSLQTDVDATLAIRGGMFTASEGTGSGVNAGAVIIRNGATLEADGIVANTGVISLRGGAETAEFLVNNNTTLSGGGNLKLGDRGTNVIYGNSNLMEGEKNLYNINDTISGSGTIVGRFFTLTNGADGIIDADGTSALNIQMNIYNSGLIEAKDASALSINSGIVNAASGTIIARDGSSIDFYEASVRGGVIKAVGSGSVYANDSVFSNIENDTLIQVGTSLGIALTGTIVNRGTIAVDGNARVAIGADVNLRGGGTIALNGSEDQISPGTPGYTFTNFDNTISGGGMIFGQYDATLRLVNRAGGLIDADDKKIALTINTLGNVITNAGTIEATGSGRVVIDSAVRNTGTLSAAGGTLVMHAIVRGSGVATVDAGTLDFAKSFEQAVTFTGSTGKLELGRSEHYTGTITGFSSVGGTSLDLRDIGFVDSTEATFSGTIQGGVLTVTDGTHTANISLTGDYLGATFMASSDGADGVNVIATGGQTPSVAHFAGAMAGMVGHGTAAGSIETHWVSGGGRMMLAAPRVALA